MAMNNCCVCEAWFNETKENPGCICPECRQKMKEQEEPTDEELLAVIPKHFYRIK
jgi:DNA-directed RNA polymerase subunit RPC12/RpoP